MRTLAIIAALFFLLNRKKISQVWAAYVPFNNDYQGVRNSLIVDYKIPVSAVNKMNDEELQIVYGGLELISNNEWKEPQYKNFMDAYDAIMAKYGIG